MRGRFDNVDTVGQRREPNVGRIGDDDHGVVDVVAVERFIRKRQLTLIDGKNAEETVVFPVSQLQLKEAFLLSDKHFRNNAGESVEVTAEIRLGPAEKVSDARSRSDDTAGVNVIKLFPSSLMMRPNKLERFAL